MNRGSGWVARHLRFLSAALVLMLALSGLVAILPTASATPGTTTPSGLASPNPAAPLAQPAGSDWPTYLGEVTRDAANTRESILSTSDASQLTLLWDYKTGGYVQSSPAIVNGTVFIGSTDGYEYALNSTTGVLKWHTFTGLEAPTPCGPSIGITSSATVAGGSVYFGGGDGYYYALNQKTGAIEWKFFVGNTTMGYYNWESPLIADGFEYLGAASKCDNPLVHGGVWQVSLTAPHKGVFFNTTPPGTLGTSVWGSPSFDAATNTIFFATGNPLKSVTTALSESVIALNASTMKFLGSWQVPAFQVIKDGDFGNTPTLLTTAKGAQLLAITNKNGYTYVLNRSNLGAGPVWEYLTSSNLTDLHPDVGPAAYGGGLLYVPGSNTTVNGVDYGGTVRAFNPNSATPSVPVWMTPEPLDVFGAPAYENGVLVVASSNQVQVLDASTGHQLWNDTTCLKKHVAAPSIAHGIIYVGCTDARVYAYGLPHGAANPPQITSVGFTKTSIGYNVTIHGSGFGKAPVKLPFTGTTSFLRIGDAAQLGSGEWGFTGDSHTLLYKSWASTRILVEKFGGAPGNAIVIAVWNPQTNGGGTWGGNVPTVAKGSPHITSVAFSGGGASLAITITGSNFGAAPVSMPFTGDLNFFAFSDFRAHCSGASALFEAGNSGWGIGSADSVTLVYVSWSSTQIKIGGFAGTYGKGCAMVNPGDPASIELWMTSDSSATGLQTAWGGVAP